MNDKSLFLSNLAADVHEELIKSTWLLESIQAGYLY